LHKRRQSNMSTTEHWQTQFDHFIANSTNPVWLNDLRRAAFNRWQTIGFPTLRNERWKYTELMPLTQAAFTLATNQQPVYQELLPAIIPHSMRLVFVDGQLQADMSTLRSNKQLQLTTLATMLEKDPKQVEAYFTDNHAIDSITDLNAALAANGAVITVPAHVKLTSPIHIIYLYTQAPDNMVHVQNIIHLAEDASATIVEHHIGHDNVRYFSTAFNNITLDKHAALTFYRCQEQGTEAYHINRTSLQQAAHSDIKYYSIDLKGHLVRNEVFQEFTGEHAKCDFVGLYAGSGKQHIDNYLSINHAVPHCTSEQLFKGILDDRAHGVFHGKVIVSKDAQKTDAKQHNANLILSDKAEIDTQPQLEIYADDVKCTHGAAIGQLDEKALFYLQSRGLSAETAKQMLVYGFAADILHHIAQADLQSFFQHRVGSYFPGMPLLQDK
ncbi:MAG: Fe-S cluster assembly protein SufD, partial [Gammaproteobacteria bacterium]